MKILLLNQTFYPDYAATAQQLADLALYLTKDGHSVTVVTGQRGYDRRDQIYPRRENWQGIDIRRVPSTGLGKHRVRYRLIDSFTFDLALLWELVCTPRQDIVISFTSPPLVGVVGNLFCLFKGGKCVQWLMDVNPDAAFEVGLLKRKSLVGRLLNWIFETSLKLSDQVVVLDRWMKKRIVAHGMPAKKIAVVPPWPVLDTDHSGRDEQIRAFKQANGLQGKFLVFFSGNHSLVHPLDTLLQAAYRLREDESIAFVFMGGGHRAADVREYRERHQLKNIHQLPPQPRELLKGAWGAGDLQVVVLGEKVNGLVHTSKVYSMLATGRPFLIIGPEESHLGDLLRECPTGYRVDHGEIDKLVAVIREAQRLTPEEKQRIEKHNIDFVQTRYRPAITLDSFSRQVLEDELISLHEPHFDSTKEFR